MVTGVVELGGESAVARFVASRLGEPELKTAVLVTPGSGEGPLGNRVQRKKDVPICSCRLALYS